MMGVFAAVKNPRRVKSHIKGMLLYYGVAIPEGFDNANWSKVFVEWLSNLKWLYLPASEALKSRLHEYRFLHAEYLRICW